MISLLFLYVQTLLAGPVAVTCGDAIERPGIYELAANCTANRDFLIVVMAESVTLDLKGRTLRCRRDRPSTIGIIASEAHRLRLMNGAIEGCSYGVSAKRADGVTIENVRFSDIENVAVSLGENDNQVLNCSFLAVGRDGATQSYAITGVGSRSVVAGNTIRDVGVGAVAGTAILLDRRVSESIIAGNRFTLNGAGADDFPIRVPAGASVVLSGNTIEGYQADVAQVPGAAVHRIAR